MNRLVRVVVASLMTLLGLACFESIAVASPDVLVQVHAYNASLAADAPVYSPCNRGPPLTDVAAELQRADDRGSVGASVRHDGKSAFVHPYDASAHFVSVARSEPTQGFQSAATTQCHVRVAEESIYSLALSGVAANTGRKTIAIGEDMEGRVIPFVKKKNGADWYKPDPNAPPSKWMENNRQWINDRMDEGCRILDCGPAPGRTNYPNPTSPYYQMELDEIFKRGYGDYQRVGID